MEGFLNPNIVFLTHNLSNRLQVLLHLLENGVISFHEFETVESKPTDFEKTIALIQLLNKKDVAKLSLLLEILRDTGNEHLVSKITEKVKINNLEHLINLPTLPVIHDIQHVGHSRNVSTFENTARENYESEKLLDEKWWPEKKVMIKSFYDRKIDGQLIIEKLYSMLQENEDKTTVITQDTLVVSGLGGIGKTSMAKSFANHYENEYYYIIWIDCGEGSLVKSFRSLARDLNIKNRAELNLEESARKCFQKLCNWKCLMIYDNAECYIGNEGIRDVLPKSRNMHSIITSRNQEWGKTGGYGKINLFSMNVFRKDESVQFMANCLQGVKDITDFHLRKLGDLLGHLPLALQVAVATLSSNKITIAEYIEEIMTNEATDIINEDFDDYELTIDKTMKISLDLIQKDFNGTDAYNILMTFGYISPEDVEFKFFQDVLNLDANKIRKAVALLERYSLLTVVKKQELVTKMKEIVTPTVEVQKLRPFERYQKIFEVKVMKNRMVPDFSFKEVDCLSIHRLLQQVIRHNGKTKEKETLGNILSCPGQINYKLIPYTYVEKYEDLKEKFAHIRSELIDQITLQELLSQRRFEEATKLSLLIYNSFNNLDSSLENQTLVSKFNYASCLMKNGQLSKCTEIFCSLSKSLQIETDVKPNANLRFWTINENGHIEFHVQNMSHKFDLLNVEMIKVFINLQLGNTKLLLQSYKFIENFYQEQKIIAKENLTYQLNQLLDILHLGLIISDAVRCKSTVISHNFLEWVEAMNTTFPSTEFAKWSNFAKTLITFAFTRTLNSKGKNLTVLNKLLLFARDRIFLINFSAFKNNTFKCKQICSDIYNAIKLDEGKETYQLIVRDLFLIVTSFSNATDEIFQNVALPFKAESSTGDYPLAFDCALSSGGEFRYRGIYDTLFIKFPNPDLLTSLHLEDLTVCMKQLYFSFTPCVNLRRIKLRKFVLWGPCTDRLILPKLNHFDTEIGESLILGLEEIYTYTLFSRSRCCLWEDIGSMQCYKIKSTRRSPQTIEFDSALKKITFDGIALMQDFPWNQFTRVTLHNCSVAFCHEENLCSCPYCQTFEIDDTNSCRKVETFCDQRCSNLHHIDIYETIFNTREDTHLSFSFFFVVHEFLSKFHNLKSVFIWNCQQPVDLSYLNNIETVEIHEGKVYFRGLKIQTSTPGGNIQVAGRQKILRLFHVVPVNDFGKVNSINFSNFNVEELYWEDTASNKSFVMFNNLPQGLLRLSLVNVELLYLDFSNIVEEISSKSFLVTLQTLNLSQTHFNSSSLNMQCISHSLQKLKLENIRLVGELSSKSQFHLRKLVLIGYTIEELQLETFKLLIRRADVLVISTFLLPNQVLVEIIEFPDNIKKIFAKITYCSSKFESKGDSDVHFEKYDKLDGRWKIADSTQQEFHKELKL